MAHPRPVPQPVPGRIGVHVDGVHAAAVLVTNGVATAARVVRAASMESALTRVLHELPAAPVTVALEADAAVYTPVRVPVPPADTAALAGLVPDGVAVRGVVHAGVFGPPPGPGRHATGLVCTWPAGLVQAAYHAARHHAGGVQVIAPALAAPVAGDLVLHVGYSCCELAFTLAGRTVAVARLAPGGLDDVEALLGGGDEVGAARVVDAMTRGGLQDRLAAAALDGWFADVFAAAAATAKQWRADGLPVPDRVVAYGPVTTAVTFPLAATDQGVPLIPVDGAVFGGLLDQPAVQRPLLVGAYLAAVADLDAVAVFDDPAEQQAAATRAAAARRRHRWRTITTTVAALAVAAGGPALLASAGNALAAHEVSTRTQALSHTTTAVGTPIGSAAAGHVLQGARDLAQLPAGVDVHTIEQQLPAPAGVSLAGVDASVHDGRTRVTFTGTFAQGALAPWWAPTSARSGHLSTHPDGTFEVASTW